MDVEGVARSAIVTGASGSIGRSIALRLARDGWCVAAVGRRLDRLSALVAEIEEAGGVACAVAADLTADDSGPEIVARAMERFGRVDALVNNAGATVLGDDDPVGKLRDALEVNVLAAYRLGVEAVRVMPTGGSIVNVGSFAGKRSIGVPLTAYSTSKAALEGLTRALAAEWGPRCGVRVNIVVPGVIAGGMSDSAGPELVARLVRRTPARRMGRPEEVAAAVAYLVGDDSEFVTGTSVVVDGGLLTT